MTAPASGTPMWDRRRLSTLLITAILAAAILLAGLGYGIYLFVGRTDNRVDSQPPSVGTDGSGSVRDDIAANPMLIVDPAAARPTSPAATPGPLILVPTATRTGPAAVDTGFPATPEGAVAQLAAIETSVLQGMSIRHANTVYDHWAATGGVGAADWRLTANVQAFLGAARMSAELDPSAAVTATPAAAQIKGADGPDWVVACVLTRVRANITVEATIAYGYCERMQWDGRWMIAPGAPPAAAPSTWPGSQLAQQAGWRTWTEDH